MTFLSQNFLNVSINQIIMFLSIIFHFFMSFQILFLSNIVRNHRQNCIYQAETAKISFKMEPSMYHKIQLLEKYIIRALNGIIMGVALSEKQL